MAKNRKKKVYPSREEMIEQLIAAVVDAEMDDHPHYEFMRQALRQGLIGYETLSTKELKKEWDLVYLGK